MNDKELLLSLKRYYSKDEHVNLLLKEKSKLNFTIGEMRSQISELDFTIDTLKNEIIILKAKLSPDEKTKIDKAWRKEKYIQEIKNQLSICSKKLQSDYQSDWKIKYVALQGKHFSMLARVMKHDKDFYDSLFNNIKTLKYEKINNILISS